MKKVLSIVASLLALVLVLTACSSKTSDKKEEKKEDKTIKVAAHVPPFTDMLELVKEDLQKEGYTLEIVKVSDNVQANVALANKEVDANFFQHEPFMKQYNEKNKTNLVAVAKVYIVNLIQINPLRCVAGVGLLAVGYVVVIDLPVQLAVSKVQLN